MKMKVLPLSFVILSSLSSNAYGFSHKVPTRIHFGLSLPDSRVCLSAADDSSSPLFFANEDEADSIYNKIGFKEENVSIGVDPKEVLKYLGTRDTLIKRFEEDNPKFDIARATEEVDRFMMDGEMVMKYIAFEKRKENVSLREEAEANLSDPATIATYAAWIIGGAGFAIVKNNYINPKYASGEWEEIVIKLPNWFGVEESAEVAADLVGSTTDVSTLTDIVQTTTDAAASGL